MRLGLFGGTFDPVHLGHLAIAECACNHLGLDEVLFIPAGQPWFKDDQHVTKAYHRLRMVQLAVMAKPKYRVSDVEVRREGLTYTVETLEALREELGVEIELYIIVGTDVLREMYLWRRPHRVLELATVVGINRPGYESFNRTSLDAIHPGASREVLIVKGPAVDVSGTDIRRRVAEGLPIKGLVPEAVESYIHEQKLYRGTYHEQGLS